MAISSLIIGIIAVILSFIPCVNWFALLPAVLGIILGFVGRSSAKKANQPTGAATAGIVLNILAVVWIFLWSLVFGAAMAGAASEM